MSVMCRCNRPSTSGLPSGREAPATRLYVGGKIFGQEDEPAPPPEVREDDTAVHSIMI